ncbi:uncharacterized, partial [Tachysurus ichikawai]
CNLSLTFPCIAPVQRLGDCSSSSTVLRCAVLRIVCSLAQVQHRHGHVAGFGSQLRHVLAAKRPYELPRITAHPRPARRVRRIVTN